MVAEVYKNRRSLRMTTKRQKQKKKQIPFGNDRKKGKDVCDAFLVGMLRG